MLQYQSYLRAINNPVSVGYMRPDLRGGPGIWSNIDRNFFGPDTDGFAHNLTYAHGRYVERIRALTTESDNPVRVRLSGLSRRMNDPDNNTRRRWQEEFRAQLEQHYLYYDIRRLAGQVSMPDSEAVFTAVLRFARQVTQQHAARSTQPDVYPIVHYEIAYDAIMRSIVHVSELPNFSLVVRDAPTTYSAYVAGTTLTAEHDLRTATAEDLYATHQILKAATNTRTSYWILWQLTHPHIEFGRVSLSADVGTRDEQSLANNGGSLAFAEAVYLYDLVMASLDAASAATLDAIAAQTEQAGREPPITPIWSYERVMWLLNRQPDVYTYDSYTRELDLPEVDQPGVGAALITLRHNMRLLATPFLPTAYDTARRAAGMEVRGARFIVRVEFPQMGHIVRGPRAQTVQMSTLVNEPATLTNNELYDFLNVNLFMGENIFGVTEHAHVPGVAGRFPFTREHFDAVLRAVDTNQQAAGGDGARVTYATLFRIAYTVHRNAQIEATRVAEEAALARLRAQDADAFARREAAFNRILNANRQQENAADPNVPVDATPLAPRAIPTLEQLNYIFRAQFNRVHVREVDVRAILTSGMTNQGRILYLTGLIYRPRQSSMSMPNRERAWLGDVIVEPIGVRWNFRSLANGARVEGLTSQQYISILRENLAHELPVAFSLSDEETTVLEQLLDVNGGPSRVEWLDLMTAVWNFRMGDRVGQTREELDVTVPIRDPVANTRPEPVELYVQRMTTPTPELVLRLVEGWEVMNEEDQVYDALIHEPLFLSDWKHVIAALRFLSDGFDSATTVEVIRGENRALSAPADEWSPEYTFRRMTHVLPVLLFGPFGDVPMPVTRLLEQTYRIETALGTTLTRFIEQMRLAVENHWHRVGVPEIEVVDDRPDPSGARAASRAIREEMRRMQQGVGDALPGIVVRTMEETTIPERGFPLASLVVVIRRVQGLLTNPTPRIEANVLEKFMIGYINRRYMDIMSFEPRPAELNIEAIEYVYRQLERIDWNQVVRDLDVPFGPINREQQLLAHVGMVPSISTVGTQSSNLVIGHDEQGQRRYQTTTYMRSLMNVLSMTRTTRTPIEIATLVRRRMHNINVASFPSLARVMTALAETYERGEVPSDALFEEERRQLEIYGILDINEQLPMYEEVAPTRPGRAVAGSSTDVDAPPPFVPAYEEVQDPCTRYINELRADFRAWTVSGFPTGKFAYPAQYNTPVPYVFRAELDRNQMTLTMGLTGDTREPRVFTTAVYTLSDAEWDEFVEFLFRQLHALCKQGPILPSSQ